MSVVLFSVYDVYSRSNQDVDNFAHLGGLLMGLLTAMVLYPIISPSTRHRIIVITLRLIAAPLAVVLFLVLIRNFYTSNPYAGEQSIDLVRRRSCSSHQNLPR